MPDEFRYLSVQFKIEHNRLRNFGQAAGLTETRERNDSVRGIEAKKDLLLSILTEIKEVLERFTKNNTKQEISPISHESYPTQNYEQGDVGKAYNSLASNVIAPEKPPIGIYRSLKWGLFDKDNFVKLLQRLRRSNNYLHELLDDHQKTVLQRTQQETNMELIQVRSSVDDLTILAKASQSSQRSPEQFVTWQQKGDLELENLVTFKILYASLLERTRSNLKGLNLPTSYIRLFAPKIVKENHPQASFIPDDSSPSTVWVSWQSHETPDERPERTSLTPIEELTALLMAPKPDEFCVPPCLGYCNFGPELDHRLGLIFKTPPHVNPNTPPQSLLQAMRAIPKPSLTRRIILAHKMAQCLLYFHSVNWLHKGLRSENILFFPPSNNSTHQDQDYMTSPYLTGFGYSRRARFNEATTHVPRSGSVEVYRHPDIQENGPRLYYRKTFDIYSLGIILIEIAHWMPIVSVVGIEDTMEEFPDATANVQSRWLSSDPALERALRGEVGDRYADVVKTCIAGRDSFGIARSDRETNASTSLIIQRGFNARVVGRLCEIAT